MPDAWLSGAERRLAPTDGGSMIAGSRTCALLHTTEGPTLAGALAALDAARAWSHLVISFEERRIVQCIPFDRAARSAQNDPGGVETNRLGPIQVEIVGYAREARHWSTTKLAWIADVLVQIRRAGWVFDLGRYHRQYDELDYHELRPAAGQYLASEASRTRMSMAAWTTFDGICTHQEVPENDHWDCGAIDLAYISKTAVRLHSGAPDPEPEEDPTVARRVLHPKRPADTRAWPHAALSPNGEIIVLFHGARLDGDERFGTARVRKLRQPAVEILPGAAGVVAVRGDGSTREIAWA